MNTLVLYDSQYGNTERIAETVAAALRQAGEASAVPADSATPIELDGVDLLVLGSPTLGWRPSPAILAALDKLGSDEVLGLMVACFDTRYQKPRWLTGSAARSMEKRLRVTGASIVAPAESFFVQGKEGPLLAGEIDRAARWAQALITATEPVHTD